MPKYTLRSRGENWFHFRLDPKSTIQSFSVTYCHDGTVCMTGDMGCIAWQRLHFPVRMDYGFPYARTVSIEYFAQKMMRADESQPIRSWNLDVAIADIAQAMLEDRDKQDSEALKHVHAQMYGFESDEYGYSQMLAAFDDETHEIEGEEYCEFGWGYSPTFKKRFDMLRSVSEIILDAVAEGDTKMNKRTELDPVHQDHPLDDLGVSEDIKEVNKQ